jgi:hypothetical protein
MGGTLNLREMLFVAIAWLPKATVQVIKYSPIKNYKYIYISQNTVIEGCWLQGAIHHITLVSQEQNFLPCRQDPLCTLHIIMG